MVSDQGGPAIRALAESGRQRYHWRGRHPGLPDVVFLLETVVDGGEHWAIRHLELHTGGRLLRYWWEPGALWFVAVVASVRQGDPRSARDRLRKHALLAARAAGEGNVMGTGGGPSNVDLHAMSVEMESGDTATPQHVVSEILGHASITDTKDVYGHLLEGDKQAAATSMSRALFGS